ncbi:MAG: hypothetical protein WB992_23455 [Bryobacteraceae bacterium]
MISGRLPDLLKRFVKALEALKASLDKHAETVRIYGETANGPEDKQPPQPVIGIELRLPVEVGEYCNAENQTRPSKRFRTGKTILEIVAVSTAVAVAILTNCSLRQIKRQADMAQLHLAIVDRPLIGLARPRFERIPPFWPNGEKGEFYIPNKNTDRSQLSLRVYYRNSGTIPAVQCYEYHLVKVGPHVSPYRQSTNEEWRKVTLPSLQFNCPNPGEKGAGDGPLFPSAEPSPRQAFNNDELATLNYPDVISGKNSLYIIGCIRYESPDCSWHRTDFCFYFAQKNPGERAGGIDACPKWQSAN